MPTNSARTFVALPIPEVQRTRLGRLQSLLAPDLPGARWVTPDQFHLTLAFLGDVPDLDLAPVCRGIAEAAARSPRMTLNLQSLGAFPDAARPRTVWVGLAGPGLDALLALRADIAEAVAAAGYPAEGDVFVPHITLGRIKVHKEAPEGVERQVAHFRTWSAGNFEASQVITHASTLAPEGPTYMTLATSPLRGPKRRSDA